MVPPSRAPLMTSARAATLSVMLPASNNEGAITSTTSSRLIAIAASDALPHSLRRSHRYSGQLAEQTTAANRIAGMNGLSTR